MITDLKHILGVTENLKEDYKEAGLTINVEEFESKIQGIGQPIINRIKDEVVKQCTASYYNSREHGKKDAMLSIPGIQAEDRKQFLDLITEYFITPFPGNEAALVFAGHQYGHVLLDINMFINKMIEQVAEYTLEKLAEENGDAVSTVIGVGKQDFQDKMRAAGKNPDKFDIN